MKKLLLFLVLPLLVGSLSAETPLVWRAAVETNPSVTVVHKFGHNHDLGSSLEDINASGGIYSWPTTAVTLEAISTNSGDNAAGAGARTVTVQGLDASLLEIEETITLHASDGTNASDPTTKLFLRIHRAFVATSGTYADTDSGSHLGDITIRTSSAGATHISIDSENGVAMGQSEVARFTIPANKIGLLLGWSVNHVSTTKTADIYLLQRSNADTTSAPFGAKRVVMELTGIVGAASHRFEVPIRLAPKTDIWIAGIASGSGAKLEATFGLLLFSTP